MLIMQIAEFHLRITKNHENPKILRDNYENHENHENSRENQENHENSLRTLELQQKHENLRIPHENQ